MVLRKPYAFLIQHFRKIHVVLLLLAAYLFFKTNQVNSFINEFLSTRTYNSAYESIDTTISFLVYLFLFLVLIGTAVLAYLLRHKKKPWKAYIIPAVVYIILFVLMIMTSSFFHNYGDESNFVLIRTIGQFLGMDLVFQYAVFLLLLIRITGIDLKKFDFVHDQEYLEIKEEDREEFEVSIELDKESVVRFFKKQWRHIKYLYLEHPLVFNTLFTITVIVFLGYGYYYFGIVNKTYREGDSFEALSYQMKILDSYFTKTNYRGDVIKEGKDYVAVIITVKNNGAKRQLNIDRFRLLNHNHTYSYTRKEEASFKDLGATYKSTELNPQASTTFYLVFEVDEKLSKNDFVLYYQDIPSQDQLRFKKIKLTPEDLHEVEKVKTVKNEEKLKISGIAVDPKEITFLKNSFQDQISYSTLQCSMDGCNMASKQAKNTAGKILEISYASLDFEGKDFVDFSTDYGRIDYKDNSGKVQSIRVESVVKEDFAGKYLYLKVPSQIEQSNSIQLIYTIRNKEYSYQIK